MRSVKAAELFIKGYNCAQSVFMAYSDITGLSLDEAAKIASGFGGGIGGIREVCGAFSGMVLAYNYLYGYTDPQNAEEKNRVYSDIQNLEGSFKSKIGSIICKDILKSGISIDDMNEQEQEYCKLRPCAKLVITAVKTLEIFIENNPSK